MSTQVKFLDARAARMEADEAAAFAGAVHVTRISGGDVYGHTTKHCAAGGCNGTELYFSALRGSVEPGDGGCVRGDVVYERAS